MIGFTGELRRWFYVPAFFCILGMANATPITFRGCFVSGPDLTGAANGEFNGDVDTITGALVGTGSWQNANITKLKNGGKAAITDCIAAAKAAALPGDEFVFYFAGHGGDSFFPDAAEAGESAGNDNHIRIGNSAAGADRITDDELTALLSGFMSSVTINVILDSCYSHTFYDGANDLSSVTQLANGNPVNAADHLALLTASSPGNPTCGGGFTKKLAEGLEYENGKLKADTNGDGTVTTEEAGKYAGAYNPTSANGRCEGGNCEVPPNPQSTQRGPEGCDAFDPVCPTTAQAVPEPRMVLVTGVGLLAILRRRRFQGG